MTFSPIIPASGYVGWVFLQKTQEKQEEVFEKSPQIARDVEYFSEHIAEVKSAEELVKDPRLLRVALGAFGLDDDINNKFFIQKILHDGTTDPKALANKLSNKQYATFSKEFGFGPDETSKVATKGFAERIIAQYKERQFERAVGDVDDDMRLALNAERELPLIALNDSSDRSKWFTILGNPPLKKIFQVTYGLPSSFGTLDIDRQVNILEERTKKMFGDESVSQFSDPKKIEDLIQRFFLQNQISQVSVLSGNQIALTILSNGAL